MRKTTESGKDFFAALDALEAEKGIPKDVVIAALEVALVNAYKKHYGVSKAVSLKLNPEKSTVQVIAFQTVVEEVVDKDTEISLEDARLISRTYKVGDIVSEEVINISSKDFFSKEFGRIAVMSAKQIVMQKLREIESENAYRELSQKEDELITCVVRRIEGKNVYVDISKLEATLMPQDLLPSDRLRVGDRIKVYVKKIKQGLRGPQILVSRTAPDFVRKLFELESPEIANGLVEVKAIAREAGYRTKMAVFSADRDIDAVGACVGNRGMRVNSIVSELGGEKIDIIPWCEDILEFIARALSPAKVVFVQVDDDDHTAKVVVPDDMLSLAIGRDGQNARLAARLTGWKIDVKSYSAFVESQRAEQEELEREELDGEGSEGSIFDEELI